MSDPLLPPSLRGASPTSETDQQRWRALDRIIIFSVLGVVAFGLLALVIRPVRFLIPQQKRAPYDRAVTRQFIESMGYADYFRIQRENVLKDLPRQRPELTAAQLAQVGEYLSYSNFEWAFARPIEEALSLDDLKQIIAFHRTGVGQKKIEKMKELLILTQREGFSKAEIDSLADDFFSGLSGEESAQLRLFDLTGPGRRFSAAYANLMGDDFEQALDRVMEDALTKVSPAKVTPTGMWEIRGTDPLKKPALPPVPPDITPPFGR